VGVLGRAGQAMGCLRTAVSHHPTRPLSQQSTPPPTHSATDTADRHLAGHVHDLLPGLKPQVPCRGILVVPRSHSPLLRPKRLSSSAISVTPAGSQTSSQTLALFFLPSQDPRLSHARPPYPTPAEHHDHHKMELAIGQQPSNGLAYTNRYVCWHVMLSKEGSRSSFSRLGSPSHPIEYM
jgi:hypothetical protein